MAAQTTGEKDEINAQAHDDGARRRRTLLGRGNYTIEREFSRQLATS